jgi:GTP pyrophosphokinase
LPQNSVPIDLAYAIHSQVGDKTVGARVNGKMVPLSHTLKTGDIVEIITATGDSKPNRDWLKIVQSTKAKQKIKSSLRKEQKSDSLDIGKRKLNEEIKKRSLPSGVFTGQSDTFQKIANEFGFKDIDSLFTSVGENHISPENVINKYVQTITPEIEDISDDEINLEINSKIPIKNDLGKGILVDGQKGLLVKLALCCTPVPGDEIVGFLTQTQGVSVHNINCKNAKHLQATRSERVVKVEWAQKQDSAYTVNLEIETVSRSGLFNEISGTFKEKKVDIASFSSRETKDNINIIEIKAIVSGPRMISELISELKKIDGIYDVHRVNV